MTPQTQAHLASFDPNKTYSAQETKTLFNILCEAIQSPLPEANRLAAETLQKWPSPIAPGLSPTSPPKCLSIDILRGQIVPQPATLEAFDLLNRHSKTNQLFPGTLPLKDHEIPILDWTLAADTALHQSPSVKTSLLTIEPLNHETPFPNITPSLTKTLHGPSKAYFGFFTQNQDLLTEGLSEAAQLGQSTQTRTNLEHLQNHTKSTLTIPLPTETELSKENTLTPILKTISTLSKENPEKNTDPSHLLSPHDPQNQPDTGHFEDVAASITYSNLRALNTPPNICADFAAHARFETKQVLTNAIPHPSLPAPLLQPLKGVLGVALQNLAPKQPQTALGLTAALSVSNDLCSHAERSLQKDPPKQILTQIIQAGISHFLPPPLKIANTIIQFILKEASKPAINHEHQKQLDQTLQ